MNSERYAAVFSVLIKESENRCHDLKKNHFFGTFATPFSVDKCITCKFSQGTYRVAIRHSTKKKKKGLVSLLVLHKPSLTKEIPCFTVMLYSYHLFLAVYMFMNNYCQGWNTGRVLFHQKSLMNTLENSLEMATTATEPAWCVSFTKTRSNIPYAFVAVFCFTKNALKIGLVT